MALGRLKQRCLGCFDAAGLASQHRETNLFSFSAGDVPTKTMLIGMLRYSLDISATQKARVNIESRLPLLRAGGPVRPTAIFSIQLVGSYTRPASRGTRRATAVKPRPSRMSLYVPQRPMDAMWGQGALPLVRAMRHIAEWRSSIQLTRNPHQTGGLRGLSPSGGKTPAKSHVPLCPCAPMAHSPGSRGTTPCEWREWWNVGRGLKKTIQKQESGRKMLAWGGRTWL